MMTDSLGSLPPALCSEMQFSGREEYASRLGGTHVDSFYLYAGRVKILMGLGRISILIVWACKYFDEDGQPNKNID